MSTLSKPSVQTTLRYVLTYAIFIVLALVGLFVFVRLRANVLELCAYAGIDVNVMRNLNSWGAYLLFIPFLIFLVWLEAFMHKGAQMNKIWPRAGIVLGAEAVLVALTALVTYLFTIIPHS